MDRDIRIHTLPKTKHIIIFYMVLVVLKMFPPFWKGGKGGNFLLSCDLSLERIIIYQKNNDTCVCYIPGQNEPLSCITLTGCHFGQSTYTCRLHHCFYHSRLKQDTYKNGLTIKNFKLPPKWDLKICYLS